MMTTNEQRLMNIAHSPKKTDRTLLASTTDNAKILTLLSADEYTCVREAVARNSATPKKVLKSLVNDKSPYVKRALIMCKDEKILLALAGEADVEPPVDIAQTKAYGQLMLTTVVTELCKIPNLPASVYRRLAERKWKAKVSLLYGNPSCPSDILTDRVNELMASVKNNPSPSSKNRQCNTVLARIAKNPATEKETLIRLLEVPVDAVRISACQNPAIGEYEIARLINDAETDYKVLGSLCRNPLISDEQLKELSELPVSLVSVEAKRQLLSREQKKRDAEIKEETERYDSYKTNVTELPQEYQDMMLLLYNKAYETVLDYYKDCKEKSGVAVKPREVMRSCITDICSKIINSI